MPEWCAVGALLLADAALLRPAGLHVLLTPGAYWAVPLLWLAARALRGRAALLLDFMALLIACDTAVRLLTYLATAMAGPLADTHLLAMDRALGFDWAAYFNFLMGHAALGASLAFLYGRIGLFALLFVALSCWRGETERLRKVFWLLFLSSLLTALGAVLVPALGPFKSLGFERFGYFLPEIQRLRDGADLTAPLGSLQGVIGFPSFHTALALALVYAFGWRGVTEKTATLLCLMLLFGVPVFGGHYLADMLAGAGVFALSLGLVESWSAISAASAWREFAARYAGAYSAAWRSR